MLINKLKKILNRNGKSVIDHDKDQKTDVATIKIGDLEMTMARKVTIPIPHEFSIFIPRVELRQRFFRNNKLQCEKEDIYSSITIVHTPKEPRLKITRVVETDPNYDLDLNKMD